MYVLRHSFAFVLAVTLSLVSGCANSDSKSVAPNRNRLTETQRGLLEQAERHFRTLDPKLNEDRKKILADPVASVWWSGAMVRYAWGSWKQNLDKQRGGLTKTLAVELPEGYKQARAELVRIGGPAVPNILGELLQKPEPERSVGVDLLVFMGDAAVPELVRYMAQGDVRLRRGIALVMKRMTKSETVQAALLQSSIDPDYGVRATVYEGLAAAGDKHLKLLRKAAVEDEDSFVQRKVIGTLGPFKDQRTAAIVVAYYQLVLQNNDRSGIRVAEKVLEQMSGSPRRHKPEAWKRWLMTLPNREE